MRMTEDPNQPQVEETEDSGAMSFSQWSGGTADSTSGVFSEDFPYPRRRVTGYGPNLTDEQKIAVTKNFKIYGLPSQGKQGTVYEGNFLVDADGKVARAPYSPKEDTYNILFAMSDAQRLDTLRILASRGFYGSGKPSKTGTLDKDRSAFAEFLDYANSKGRTWDVMRQQIVMTPGFGVGGGTSYRTTPKEDLTEYLRKASLDRLGRTMSKADIDKAVAAIQREEATKGPQAPNVGVMAEQQVVASDPNRDKAVRFRRAIDLAMGVLGE